MSGQKLARNRANLIPNFNTERLATFLRRRHPANTADMVAARTGIAAKTVRNWLNQTNDMRAVHLLILAAEYGPDLVVAAWPENWVDVPGWLDAGSAAAELAAIEDQNRRNETRRLELQARLTAGGGS